MDNTEKNYQKALTKAEILRAIDDGSGTKSEVMGLIANFEENCAGDPRFLLQVAGYSLEEYDNWLYQEAW